MKPVVIGVGGGTASGKTYFCRLLRERIGNETCLHISLDDYYLCGGHLPPIERAKVNYDHPSSLDLGLLADHIGSLKSGNAVDLPIYDFVTHSRRLETKKAIPSEVIVVEGIHALVDDRLRNLFDIRVFLDVPERTRLERRLHRDVTERGRSQESVLDQWKATVQPMYEEFCEKSKIHAKHVLIGWMESDLDLLLNEIYGLLGE